MQNPLVFALLLLFVCADTAAGQTYNNIDDRKNLDDYTAGWGWCTDCAGGLNHATAYSIYWDQLPAVVAGQGSTEFFIAGPQYSNALWWHKLGPNNKTSFQFEYWITVDVQASSYAQAIEADVFQFIGGREFMFGTQCNYSKGYSQGLWDIWDQALMKWISTGVRCPGFVAGDWYKITWNVRRTANHKMVYDSVAVTRYNSSVTRMLSTSRTRLNRTTSSGPLPAGWNETTGVQFQLDLNYKGGQFPVWVDLVRLTAQ